MSVHPIRIPTRQEVARLTPAQKLQHVRSEVIGQLEDRIEELNVEAQKVVETMNLIHTRTQQQGFDVQLEDLKTGRWYRLSAEISALQEVAHFIEGLED